MQKHAENPHHSHFGILSLCTVRQVMPCPLWSLCRLHPGRCHQQVQGQPPRWHLLQALVQKGVDAQQHLFGLICTLWSPQCTGAEATTAALLQAVRPCTGGACVLALPDAFLAYQRRRSPLWSLVGTHLSSSFSFQHRNPLPFSLSHRYSSPSAFHPLSSSCSAFWLFSDITA